MSIYSSLPSLLKKEFLSSVRNKEVFYGYLLYVIGISFVTYIGFGTKEIQKITWNTVFWISTLFGSMHICYKSFSKDGTFYYYYTLCSPESYLLSKMIYNVSVCFIVILTSFFSFCFFLGSPVEDMGLYILAIFLGVSCLSLVFTLVNAIADKSNQKSVMVPILSFPTSLPTLMLSVKLGKNAADGIAFSQSIDEIVTLAGLFLIIFALSILLYPFIWRS